MSSRFQITFKLDHGQAVHEEGSPLLMRFNLDHLLNGHNYLKFGILEFFTIIYFIIISFVFNFLIKHLEFLHFNLSALILTVVVSAEQPLIMNDTQL